MKTLLRNIFVYSCILFLLPKFIPGVHIDGGFTSFVIGGAVLTLMNFFLRPILNIISFPINLISLGLFSIAINALILYLLTTFVTDIKISSFTYQRMSNLGFVIPQTYFNTIFAYLYTAFVISCIDKFINWLRR